MNWALEIGSMSFLVMLENCSVWSLWQRILCILDEAEGFRPFVLIFILGSLAFVLKFTSECFDEVEFLVIYILGNTFWCFIACPC